MAPITKAILKIVTGLILILGGVYGVHLVVQGVDELGTLDQMQLDVPLKK